MILGLFSTYLPIVVNIPPISPLCEISPNSYRKKKKTITPFSELPYLSVHIFIKEIHTSDNIKMIC